VVVSVIGARLGYPALDHAVAIVEAVHVVFVSGRMLGSAVSGLMDTAADPHLVERLKRVVREVETPLSRLHYEPRVRATAVRWSGQTLFVQIEVEVPGRMGVSEAEELREGIQRAVKTRVCGHSETLVRITAG
jgi:divalent metal cation (Fe/Co/Zn/Cd) transporter